MATMNESNNDLSNPLLGLTERTSGGVSPLEQEVLDEYTRLLNNMNHVSAWLIFFALPKGRSSSTQSLLYSLSSFPSKDKTSQMFHPEPQMFSIYHDRPIMPISI